jgi:hypothetical protein
VDFSLSLSCPDDILPSSWSLTIIPIRIETQSSSCERYSLPGMTHQRKTNPVMLSARDCNIANGKLRKSVGPQREARHKVAGSTGLSQYNWE